MVFNRAIRAVASLGLGMLLCALAQQPPVAQTKDAKDTQVAAGSAKPLTWDELLDYLNFLNKRLILETKVKEQVSTRGLDFILTSEYEDVLRSRNVAQELMDLIRLKAKPV